MSGEVVHFEIPADNPERARKFYHDSFGWRMDPMPDFEYTMIGTAPMDEKGQLKEPGAINGGMGKRGGPLEHPVITINVEDMTQAEKTIVKNGGKILQKKQPIGDGTMGYTGYFKDSEGNVVGLYQTGKK